MIVLVLINSKVHSVLIFIQLQQRVVLWKAKKKNNRIIKLIKRLFNDLKISNNNNKNNKWRFSFNQIIKQWLKKNNKKKLINKKQKIKFNLFKRKK